MTGSAPPPKLPPAGWYSDPEGNGLRWWDGQRWTDHRHPGRQPPEAAAFEQPALGAASPAGDAISRRGDGLPWPWIAVAIVVLAVGVFVAFRTMGSDHESEPVSAAEHQAPAAQMRTDRSEVPEQAPDRLSSGPGGDEFWVREALGDIHRACDGARKAEIAQAEIQATGPGGANVQRAIEGAIDEQTYGGLVEEEDIDHLVRIYRAHPTATYGNKSMKLVLLDAAAELGNGSCYQPGAERLTREIELDSQR